ncbi:hypothetical protein CHS0354_034442 [Potamilus streckersoni]|uniref:Uncharacterized protein n=1 Tax=Potamilus streckersoni TaxID=2493646 RepID=A0AAE0S8P2_9BIVA|nr:hypothetical protein CHS0354_034442 [Potamilus streckersoni]
MHCILFRSYKKYNSMTTGCRNFRISTLTHHIKCIYHLKSHRDNSLQSTDWDKVLAAKTTSMCTQEITRKITHYQNVGGDVFNFVVCAWSASDHNSVIREENH